MLMACFYGSYQSDISKRRYDAANAHYYLFNQQLKVEKNTISHNIQK